MILLVEEHGDTRRVCAVFSVAEASDGQAGGHAVGDWQALANKVFETDDRPIILYDGICNMCNGGVNFMLDWDSPNDSRGIRHTL